MCRAGALGFVMFGFAILLGPGPSYSQDQTPPATQPGSVPVATERPATGGMAPNSAGNLPQTATPNAQAPAAQLPPVVVITKPSTGQKAKQLVHKTSTAKAGSRSQQPPHVSEPAAGETSAITAARDLAVKNEAFNQARANLLTQLGTSTTDFNREAIQALPQGTNTPVDKVLLQAPGVTQDSAAGGQLHVRNEHANLQYRINGIILPDGVSGFGQSCKATLSAASPSSLERCRPSTAFALPALSTSQTESGSQDPGGKRASMGAARGR